jgi:hypothetical protein
VRLAADRPAGHAKAVRAGDGGACPVLAAHAVATTTDRAHLTGRRSYRIPRMRGCRWTLQGMWSPRGSAAPLQRIAAAPAVRLVRGGVALASQP